MNGPSEWEPLAHYLSDECSEQMHSELEALIA